MKVRHGRYGAFLGCLRYPECKGIINIPKKGETVISQENMPKCPAIECPGTLVARKSRYGKTFYSCSTFPECDVIVNTLEQIETKYASHPRTAYVKKAPKGKGKVTKETKTTKTTKVASKTVKKKAPAEKKKKERTSSMPPQPLSPVLAAIVGAQEMSRSEVTKKLWEYIKAHDLQDPANKRLIRPDENLGSVFGTNEPVDMFKMAGLLNPHFIKKI
jgi:DNA topoisomerase-1